MVSLNGNSKQETKVPYEPFSRKTDRSLNPTIDAAAAAFDSRKSSEETDRIQAEFRAREAKQEAERVNTVEASRSFQANRGEAMQAQERFKASQQGGISSEAQKSKQEEFGERPTLGFGWFAIALLVAAVFDVASALINLIPVAGGVISSFILMPIGMGTLFMIHKMGGVKFTGRLKKQFLVGVVVEAIPILNILPGFLFVVIVNKLLPLVLDKLENSNVRPVEKLASTAKKI